MPRGGRSIIMPLTTHPIGAVAEQVVRRPLPTDAIGAALRGAFGCRSLPEDMTRLLCRLDRTP